MNYTELIKDAWRFIWRRKAMPALAFTSLSAAVLAYLALYGAMVGIFLGAPVILERLLSIPAYMLADWPASRWGLPVVAVGLLLWPFVWLVGLGARGGMIALVDESVDGRRLSFGGALGRGLRLSPRLAVMSFLVHLPASILILAAQAALFAMIPNIINQPPEEMGIYFASFYGLSLVLSCGSYALLFFIQFIYAFAYRGIVIGDLGAVGSIRHGWQVARRHAGDLIPLAMIFIGLAILLVIIWYAAFLALYVALFVGAAVNDMQEPSPLMLAAIVVGSLLFMLVSLIVAAVQSAWRSAAFTMAYRHWMGMTGDQDPTAIKT